MKSKNWLLKVHLLSVFVAVTKCLGKTIYDPHHMEGDIEEIEGLGLS